MKRLLITLAVAALVGIIGVEFAWKAALEPTCESTVLSERKSPNETHVFSLIRRNCGATTDYVTGLSIRSAGDDFDPSARDEVLVIDGDVPVTASWISNERIEIVVPKGANIFRRDEEWNGITIEYAGK